LGADELGSGDGSIVHVKTLFPALRVSDLDVSLAFYGVLGYDVVGQVEVDPGTRLTMLALSGDMEVSLELVHRADEGPVDPGGLDHVAIQVDDLEAMRAELLGAGLEPGEVTMPGGPNEPRTASVVDPDGYHLELVQWPDGHPVDMTRADFADDLS
jgi:lactoylglutathione lyase